MLVVYLLMAAIETQIRKSIFYNSQQGTRPVPREIIEVNCQFAGYDKATVRERLDELVESGDLIEENGGYLRADN